MNILLIQTAWLGDNILTTPLVANLAKKNDVDVLTIPKCMQVYENNPNVKHIIAYDKHAKNKGIQGLRQIANQLSGHDYDAAIIPQKWWRSAIVAKLAGIPMRVGFNDAPAKSLYTHRVTYRNEEHDIIRLCELIKPLGVTPEIVSPTLYPSESDFFTIKEFIRLFHDRKTIAIAPGTAWETKRYPLFDKVAEIFTEKGFYVVAVGTESEKELCENVIKNSDGKVFTGKTILQTAALFTKISALVANDSGAGHIASGVGTPVISIFGPTTPEMGFYPWGKNNVIIQNQIECRPCSLHGSHKCPKKHHKCMRDIAPEVITDNIQALVK